MTNQPYAYITAAGIVTLLLGYLLGAAKPGHRRNAAALLTANLVLWLTGEVVVRLSQDGGLALTAIRCTYAAIAFLPSAVHSLVRTLDPSPGRGERTLVLATLLFAVGSVLLLPTDLLIGGAARDALGFHRVSGPLFPIFEAGLFALLLFDVGLTFRASRHAPGSLQRRRARYILVGVAAGTTLGIVDLGLQQVFGFRAHRMFMVPLAVTVSSGVMIYAIARTRLLDVQTAFRRSVVCVGMVLALLVPCLGVSLLADQLMTGTIELGPSFVTAGLFCVAGFWFPRIRVSAAQTLEEALFGVRTSDRRLLRAASQEVTSVLSLASLTAVTRTTLTRAFGEVDVRLWIRRGDSFLALDQSEDEVKPLDTLAVLAWAEAASDPLILSEVESSPTPLVAALRERGIEVAQALHVKDRTVGLLTLARRADDLAYTDADVWLLATLANQVAIALENARLYEELRESHEQVSRANRLSAIGTLAAWIAQEIRNPLVAVRTFMDLLPEHLDDAEFLDDFRKTALGEVNRISCLTTDLLAFTRSQERRPTLVDPDAVAAGVVSLLGSDASKQQVAVMLAPSSRLLPVRADPDQVQQVLVNLVRNALEASRPGALVTICVQPGRTVTRDQVMRISVVDQGCGITADKLEAIFTPFFSTKRGRPGLGLAVTHQLVTENGGSLTVMSTPGKGSTFTVTLPVAEVETETTWSPVAEPDRAAAS